MILYAMVLVSAVVAGVVVVVSSVVGWGRGVVLRFGVVGSWPWFGVLSGLLGSWP